MMQISCVQTRKRDKRKREAYKHDQLNERLETQSRKERLASKRTRIAPSSKNKNKLTDVCITAIVEELGRVDECGLTMRQLKHLLKLRHNLKRDKLVEKARDARFLECDKSHQAHSWSVETTQHGVTNFPTFHTGFNERTKVGHI